jgi:hypothetical protein
VLGVELTLMRIAALTVLAQRLANFAHAASPLVDDHPVADG